ncbi:hypothetical protein LINGRAHAP2_LOCUS30996 [Linum grandiflorum]
MRMDSRFQLICLQVQQPKRNLSLNLENPSLYESKISSPGEMAFDSNTPEDFNSGSKENNKYILNLDTISGIPHPESCSVLTGSITLEEFIRRLFICCQTGVGTLLRLSISGNCI